MWQMTDEICFSRRFILLLEIQRRRVLMEKKGASFKSGFHSVGEVLGSDGFINHVGQKYGTKE